MELVLEPELVALWVLVSWALWRGKDSDSEDEDGFQDLLGWADLEVENEEVIPTEILGWLLLRRAGLPASSRLSVQASVGNSLKFADLERALRDQEEELLAAEQSRQHRPNAGPRRTYWVEENGEWGLINEEVDEENLGLGKDAILWAENPPSSVLMATPETSSWDEEVWHDGAYDWIYHTDGEWYTQLEDGMFLSYADMKPWMEIDEIAYHDASLGKEISDAYTAVQEKVRTFQEARHAVQQKGKTRGFFRPKGKPKGSWKEKSKGKGTVLASFPSHSGKGYGSQTTSGYSPVNSPGYKGCFICGDKTHEFRNCPKRGMQKDSGGKGTRSVFMVTECEGSQRKGRWLRVPSKRRNWMASILVNVFWQQELLSKGLTS